MKREVTSHIIHIWLSIRINVMVNVFSVNNFLDLHVIDLSIFESKLCKRNYHQKHKAHSKKNLYIN